ncbi:serine/threonine protein kinase [Paenibacillus xylanexedens]|uniref:Serine/threonine protein kinase n=1 Tax=Paenibacillus xylanexedens TaxID=528191 RepID=A0ABS4RL84_PAEXY|nr:serine/threonine-protein kinase [Paenibacillus xylanexedens]MBP2243654.1 serine/threonine protein kinase [Paenibacillus xylanexedens]
MRKDNCKMTLQRNVIINDTYQVRQVLASSELAIVYAGRDRNTGAKVAIKEFFPQRMAERQADKRGVFCSSRGYGGQYQELLGAFLLEGELLSKLDHPHIVSYLDHFEANGTGYLVMEYCTGITLTEYLNEHNHALDAAFITETLLPLVDTLDYIHKQGILHRDVKPSNIMVMEDGTPKLLDFGSATRWPMQSGEKQVIFTSAGYSPLEFYSEKSSQGPMSDIYSLAALLHYWTCGQPPMDVKQRLFQDELPSVRSHNEYVNPWLARVIHWGLTVRSEKRCASLAWVRSSLRVQAWVWKVRKPGTVEWSLAENQHTQVYEVESKKQHEMA